MPSMVDRKCVCCSLPFKARTADVKRGWARFCSKSCKAKVQERRNGQHAAYLQGRGVSNLHPERLQRYDYHNDGGGDHPFSSEGLGQWHD